jgi:hypothetical protein
VCVFYPEDRGNRFFCTKLHGIIFQKALVLNVGGTYGKGV